MARKPKPFASRDIAVRRVALALMLCLAGAGAGALLGNMTVGTGLGRDAGDAPSFAHLSANPDALATGDAAAAPPCPGCADSYGVGARMRTAAREVRMDNSFRELGAVEIETALPAEPRDDYLYGGRFPDPPAQSREPVEIIVEPSVEESETPAAEAEPAETIPAG